MLVLAIDPGPFESGIVIFNGKEVLKAEVLKNHDVLPLIKHAHMQVDAAWPDLLAIEMIASYGMPVGAEVFETCVWIGRFMQYWCHFASEQSITRIPRKEVKVHLCGTTKAKDANIRQALIDRIGPQGTKKAPGPTYGVKSHCWPALAVAVVAQGVVR